MTYLPNPAPDVAKLKTQRKAHEEAAVAREAEGGPPPPQARKLLEAPRRLLCIELSLGTLFKAE